MASPRRAPSRLGVLKGVGRRNSPYRLKNHVCHINVYCLYFRVLQSTLSTIILLSCKYWCSILVVEVTDSVVNFSFPHFIWCVKRLHEFYWCSEFVFAGCAKIPGTVCTDEIQGSSWAGRRISSRPTENTWDCCEVSGRFLILLPLELSLFSASFSLVPPLYIVNVW